jgi:mitogen-activated protein kinase kinase kinase
MVNSRPSSQGHGAVPRLSVSVSTAPSPPPQAGPSNSNQSGSGTTSIGSLGRRPLGARKRGVAAGLYVANPDNSDEDGSPTTSTAQSHSPIRTQSSPTSTPGAGRVSYEGEYRGLPNIPHSTPPLPPPQPDRHNQAARRAYTTPPEAPAIPQRPHDTRHSSLSAQGQGQGQLSQSNIPPPSPSRLSRHALPSPPTHSSPPTQESRRLPQPQIQVQPNPNIRMSSPEEGISPVIETGGGMRARSGSFNASAKRLLQVTTDNEQFTLVDITGMNTAEAIRDRIFSKVRRHDWTVLRTDELISSYVSEMTNTPTYPSNRLNTEKTQIQIP